MLLPVWNKQIMKNLPLTPQTVNKISAQLNRWRKYMFFVVVVFCSRKNHLCFFPRWKSNNIHLPAIWTISEPYLNKKWKRFQALCMKTMRGNKTKSGKEQGVWIIAQNGTGVRAQTSLDIPFFYFLAPMKVPRWQPHHWQSL